MYSIYFNKRILKVCEFREDNGYNPNAIVYHCGESSNLNILPKIMDTSTNIKLMYVPVNKTDIEHTFKNISSEFTQINAGGGLVQNNKGEYLLIFRNGVWDLPKGKQEPNEDIRNSAQREVMEECGINNPDDLQIGELLCITHHTYHLKEQFMLKHTYWYKMIYNGKSSLTPQIEEDIQQCKWVKKEDLHEYLNNTYPSIITVFENEGVTIE